MDIGIWGVRGLYVAATLLGCTLAYVLWQNRDKKGALPLAVTNLSAAFWSFGLLVTTAPWDTVAITSMQITYLGVGGAVTSGFLFALEYTGRERFITKSVVGVLVAYPLVLASVTILNPGGFFFTGLDPAAIYGVEQQWGIGFWLHSAFSYGLIVIYMLMLIDFLYRSRETLYRGQVAALILGLVTPAPFNLVYLGEVVTFDTTPIGFLAAAACFTVAIVGYQYTNLTPIAREKVIHNVRDGMIVVDADDAIVESNPAARRMLGADESLVGRTMGEVLAISDTLDVYEELTEEVTSAERTVTFGQLYLHLESTPIIDDRDRHVGWLFLIQDVTEQKRRERDLEQQIEKLDQFASLVSHDLRNPINVAAGYIQQTKATGDLDHLDKVEEATERMEVIIQDVLALAREGQDVTDPGAVSVAAIARNAWSNVDTAGASIEIPDDATIVADGTRLQRLFENLFRNAIEHGTETDSPNHPVPDELTITVGVERESEAVLTLSVADDGVGIPPDAREQVFEDGYSTGDEGTGLGLAIVEQIAGAHGWKVIVTESDDGGARFEISGVREPIEPQAGTHSPGHSP